MRPATAQRLQLFDLRGRDLRLVVRFDEGYASTSCASSEEGHHIDDLAELWKRLADIPVERVDPLRRVLRDERHSEGSRLGHRRTMSRLLRFAVFGRQTTGRAARSRSRSSRRSRLRSCDRTNLRPTWRARAPPTSGLQGQIHVLSGRTGLAWDYTSRCFAVRGSSGASGIPPPSRCTPLILTRPGRETLAGHFRRVSSLGVLSGLRVVEFSAFVAAPLASATLASLGADVIRVEQLGGGIDAGRWPLHEGRSLYRAGLDRGKRSLPGPAHVAGPRTRCRTRDCPRRARRHLPHQSWWMTAWAS